MTTNPFDKAKYPNVWRAHNYAERVVSGEIVACIYIKAACERYLREVVPGYSSNFHFDADKAEKFLRLVQRFEHVKGKWDSKEIIYEDWQCWVWANIMGFQSNITGFRRFRTAHVEVARGNAKSAMASQAVLYFLALDDPQGNEISTVATKKEQARIVLDSARAMGRKSASYRKATGVTILAHSIVHKASDSIARALSSEHSGLDGLNDILAVCDELHAMRRETFEVISSGMSKRKDSLILCITTAGFNTDSVGYTQSIYAKKVALGDIDDDLFFAAVYTLDEGDEWDDEKVWIKANPNWEISVDPHTFRAKVQKAIETPADVANVKVKHLNLWLSEANAYFSLEKWDACADPSLKIEDFRGQKRKMGLDLASTVDLCGHASLYKKNGVYYVFEKMFIPEGTVKEVRSALYDEAIAKGYLYATPGEAINHELIRNSILDTAADTREVELGYDPWNATEMSQQLANKLEVVKFGMNVGNLSEPMKKLNTLIREGKIRHNGSPLLRWCIGNVVAKEDHNQNVFPRKSHPRLKIDPVICILIALALWLADEQPESVYETRGLRSL